MSVSLPEPGESGGAARLGLAGSVTIVFVALTVFAISLNVLVTWQLSSLLAGSEDARAARESVRMVALAMSEPTELAPTIVDAGTWIAAASYDLEGREVRRAGEVPVNDAIDTAVFAALRSGDVGVQRVGGAHGPLLKVIAPVSSATVPRGALTVWVRPSGTQEATRARRLALAYAALNAVVIGMFGWYLITRTIVRPVRRLSVATRALAGGDLGVRVRVEGFGELESLARDFNRMTEALSRKVGELEEANRSLRVAREEVIQAEKLASVGRLAAGVAHELGNPVAAVTGYVSMLLRGRESDGSADSDVLRRVDREMKRIDRIIRDLLEYARPRPETVVPLEVDAVVESALAIVIGQKGFRGVEVVKRLGAPAKVAGDPHRLSQVLVNLLINAADAVEGAERKTIEISTFETRFPEAGEPRRRGEDPPRGPAVAVRVSDTGPGLSPADRDRLFEPFYTTKRSGTGLGLAISRTIVESMRGLIVAGNEPGGGATFTVLLPPEGAVTGPLPGGS